MKRLRVNCPTDSTSGKCLTICLDFLFAIISILVDSVASSSSLPFKSDKFPDNLTRAQIRKMPSARSLLSRKTRHLRDDFLFYNASLNDISDTQSEKSVFKDPNSYDLLSKVNQKVDCGKKSNLYKNLTKMENHSQKDSPISKMKPVLPLESSQHSNNVMFKDPNMYNVLPSKKIQRVDSSDPTKLSNNKAVEPNNTNAKYSKLDMLIECSQMVFFDQNNSENSSLESNESFLTNNFSTNRIDGVTSKFVQSEQQYVYHNPYRNNAAQSNNSKLPLEKEQVPKPERFSTVEADQLNESDASSTNLIDKPNAPKYFNHFWKEDLSHVYNENLSVQGATAGDHNYPHKKSAPLSKEYSLKQFIRKFSKSENDLLHIHSSNVIYEVTIDNVEAMHQDPHILSETVVKQHISQAKKIDWKYLTSSKGPALCINGSIFMRKV